jgi:hypothetical protein
MAGRCEGSGRWGNAKKDDGRKTVYRKNERKAPLEMDGRCTSRSERNGNTTVDREGRGQAIVEIGCQGGQGSPRAVAPSGWICISEQTAIDVIYSIELPVFITVAECKNVACQPDN